MMLMLFLWTGLSAQQVSISQVDTNKLPEKTDNTQRDFNIKLKASLVADNVLSVRASINNIINTEEDSKLNKEAIGVIHIAVKLGNKIVFDATVSDAITKRQALRFYTLDTSSIVMQC